MNETVVTNETTLTEAVEQAVSKGKDWKGIAIGVGATIGVYFAGKLLFKGGKKLLANKNWIPMPQQQEAQAAVEEPTEPEKVETKKTQKR